MSKQKSTEVTRSPGRPRATIKWPHTSFTFPQLQVLNGCNPKTGEGDIAALTLRNGMDRDMYILDGDGNRLRLNPNSLIVNTGKKRTPEGGLGRKLEVFCRRATFKGTVPAMEAPAATPAKATAAKAKKRKAKVAPVAKAKRKYTRKATVTTDTPVAAGDATSATTKVYEDIKNILATPTPPVPALSVPVVDIPAPAPVAETPAPAPAETVAVAAEATAAVS